jgi:hypothetical protein
LPAISEAAPVDAVPSHDVPAITAAVIGPQQPVRSLSLASAPMSAYPSLMASSASAPTSTSATGFSHPSSQLHTSLDASLAAATVVPRSGVSFVPGLLTPRSAGSLSGHALATAAPAAPFDLPLHLDSVRAVHATRLARAELLDLRDSVAAEQERLELLSTLRKEREAEERARLAAAGGGGGGPSFLLAQRMPSSPLLPPYPTTRTLTQREEVDFDHGGTAAAAAAQQATAKQPQRKQSRALHKTAAPAPTKVGGKK